MEASNGIVVDKLVREYRKGPRAVDGIDLTVAPGEIYGFLGPNGAGKSTTVHVLTTLLPPTSGTARVGGHDVVKEGPKVRSLIGVALQEAALDPLLTGRDHLRLQATLQGVPKAQRRVRADDLLERVGLADAGDRKVSGYSGGMKRRLDLALALIHAPRILFLDEPTTGLDPQSRTALWEEVARLRREDLVTVFLTTQYLEEADVLADRVGIIDQGKIVAEGTPAELKAEIGRPSVHAIPHREEDKPRIAEFLSRFGEPLSTTKDVAVRLRDGLGLTDIVRAVDADGVDVVDLELRAPTLDDVFLAKTGRTLEGATEEAEAEQQDATPASSTTWVQVGAIAQRSIVRTARQPASFIPPLIFPIALMAVNAAGLQSSTELAGFPTDSFLAFALAVPFIQGALFSTMNAGTDLARDIQTGFVNRLALTALRDWALLSGQLAGVVALGIVQALFYLAVGLASGVEIASGPLGVVVLLVYAAIVSLAFGALGSFLAFRTGSGETIQALFPVLFVFLFISSMNTPRELIGVEWFRIAATLNPVSYMIECIRSLIITGWDAQALALGFGFVIVLGIVSLVLASSALRTRMTRT